MNKKRIVSIIMAVLMVVTMLPSFVFAAPSGKLDGKLKVKGTTAVGSTLSAEYKKVTPEGVTDDDVTFSWSRKVGKDLTEVGTEKTYIPTEEDLGYKLELKITGIESLGLTGSLTAESREIMATVEEAEAAAAADPDPDETDDALAGAGLEEVLDEIVEDITEEIPEETENWDEEVYVEESEEFYEESQPEDTGIPEATDDGTMTGIPEATEDGTMPEELDEAEAGIGLNEEEPLTYAAEASTDTEENLLDFGSLEQGAEIGEAQFATVKNAGTGTLNFAGISPKHFMVQDIEEPLEAGEEITLWIQPREGLEPGEYHDVITYTADEGAAASFEAVVVVNEKEESAEEPEEAPVDDTGLTDGETGEGEIDKPSDTPLPEEYVSVSADPLEIRFDNVKAGYTEAPEAVTVTLLNNGTKAVNLAQPAGENFEAGALSAETLNPEESATFTVVPKPGLAEGDYLETITVRSKEEEGNPSTELCTVSVGLVVEQADSVVKLTADVQDLDFGTAEEGYTEAPQAQTVTLTNEGNQKLVLAQPMADLFEIGALSAAEVNPGESVTFTVQPKAGLNADNYKETIFVVTAEEEGTLATELCQVTAGFAVEKAEVIYKLSVSLEDVDFGSAEEGYEKAPAAESVTVTNEGNTAVTLEQPTSDYFVIGKLSATVLNPGESAEFTVRPKKNLEEGNYLDVILIPNDGEAQALVNAYFSVTAKSNKLLSVEKPADIKNLPFGTEKTVKGLKLPSTVVIKTTEGKKKAEVKWNVKDCTYNPKSTDPQTFTVKGTVVLPEGVSNPDKISRKVSVKVSVKGYAPKIADANDNWIGGISPDGDYTTETKITITAVGAGMDNKNPSKDDTRYVPLNWGVLETRPWDGAPYAATFRMGQPGNYTLSVTFNQQKFDGSNWFNTGEQSTRKVNFTVAKAGAELTPAADRSDANRKDAVKTGDDTPIMPFVIILVLAVVCIAGVVIYRKKK